MKKFITTSIIAVLVTLATTTVAQERPDEYLGLPGDNLNLYAVMKLFQESETLEGFERSLNDQNSRINNLDLNGDNYVDYIRVIDYVDGDVHNIVLQVALDRNENQDVAVFTVQPLRDGSVQIQLIGDEALYGRNYIIEPIYDDYRGETPNPGYIGNANRRNVTVVRTTYVEVAAWPLVRYIYRPNYVVWRSSWYYGYYPPYWRPWNPYYWHYYYGYHYNWYSHYYGHYRHWNQPRYTRWNDFYYSGKRSYSPYVAVRIKEGNYRTTYSRPEQRSDGEALYSRMHPDQGTRASGNTPAASQGRRSVSQSSREGTNTGTTTTTTRRSTNTVTNRTGTGTSTDQNRDASRRSSTTVPGRTGTGTSTGQNSDASRRSSTAVPDRTGTGTSAGQNSDASRRSSATVPGRTGTSTSAGQNSDASRRSSTTVPDRAGTSSPRVQSSSGTARRSADAAPERVASRSETVKRAETSQTSRQSTVKASSPERRSSVASKKETTTQSKSGNAGETESGKATRRK